MTWKWTLVKHIGIPIVKWVLQKIGERHLRLKVFNNFLIKELTKLKEGKELEE